MLVCNIKFKTPCTSCTEDAEFTASVAALGKLLWFRELAADTLCLDSTGNHPPSVFYNNNAAALSTIANGDFRSHSRHIAVQYCRATEVATDRKEVDMRHRGMNDNR